MNESESAVDGARGHFWELYHPPDGGEQTWLLRNHEGEVVGQVIERQVTRHEGEVIRWVPYGADGAQIHSGTPSAVPSRRDVEESVGLRAGSVPVIPQSRAAQEALRVELTQVDAELLELGRRYTELTRRRLAIMAELVAPAMAVLDKYQGMTGSRADRVAERSGGDDGVPGEADTPGGSVP
jgi:hypothetical protein